MSSLGHFVCLVFSFRYNGLATLALVAFGRVRALRAHCGPFGPAMHEKQAGITELSIVCNKNIACNLRSEQIAWEC